MIRRRRTGAATATAAATNNPKRNSMPPGRHSFGAAVLDFSRGKEEHYRVKICFVGDRGCGRTRMIEYVCKTRNDA